MSQPLAIEPYVEHDGETHRLQLSVEGMHCSACIWRIESTLNAQPDVRARVNLSTGRLTIEWQGEQEAATRFVREVEALGYRTRPFDSQAALQGDESELKSLLRYIAVSGFASGNIMIFSLVLWFSHGEDVGEATRHLMHWLSALIALPAVIYAGQPFFRSALSALRKGHVNMDVPIALAVALASAMSLFETIRRGDYVYFDSAVMLVFLLLIGRYLDRRARGKAKAAAADLLSLFRGTATVVELGSSRHVLIRDLAPGMLLRVAAGETIAADGVVRSGSSEADTSLITGETIPAAIAPGTRVFAGTLNLTAPIDVEVLAASESSLLADMVRLMEKAEQSHARYVRVADRVAQFYTPAVHVLALATFLGWWLGAGMAWQPALLIATTVLIITCPCALGLAVPAVQVRASGLLFRQGILLKSADALERLARIDTVVFDKTGTLTLGKPAALNAADLPRTVLHKAASLASHSKHPLAAALRACWNGPLMVADTAAEIPGVGLRGMVGGDLVFVGRGSAIGITEDSPASGPRLYCQIGEQTPHAVDFTDALRTDAPDVIRALQRAGHTTWLLSGDRKAVVDRMQAELTFDFAKADLTPAEKTTLIEAHKAAGHRVLMVGDGLNDAAALSAADVSMSPATGIDITQNAADLVFQGSALRPVLTSWQLARAADRLVKQNFVLSFLYNAVAVPLAVMGMVTPLIAAIAMSSSSILVVANALRLRSQEG